MAINLLNRKNLPDFARGPLEEISRGHLVSEQNFVLMRNLEQEYNNERSFAQGRSPAKHIC
jgi:hypothetical protein